MDDFIEIEIRDGHAIIPVKDIKSAFIRNTSAGTIFDLHYGNSSVQVTNHEMAEKNYKIIQEELINHCSNMGI